MRFNKIIAVATLGLLALSCATNPIDDINIDASQTTITLSLTESRTALGEKADGIYPLHWSEGDKISVNGIESAEAEINAADPSRATFSIKGTIEQPFCIAYPAAPEGKVLFAENQSHASNTTFGNNIATMYGYQSNENAQLKHLTGVLKFGIVGSATLSKIEISSTARTPIAGLFDIDFQTGDITPSAEAKSLITYIFDNGAKLSAATPTTVHIAIPAGIYPSLYAILYDTEGGSMLVEINAPETKPITAGNIREFSNNINYTADTPSDVAVGRPLPHWSEGYLDIHFINSASGECAFYVLPDGTTMVVDVGELSPDFGDTRVPFRPSEGVRPYITYANYIKHFIPRGKTAIDYCQISHFHIDHFGDHRIEGEVNPIVGYRRIGAMALYDEIPFNNILDRAYPDYVTDDKTPVIEDDKLIEDWKMLINWGEANGKFKAARFTPGEKQIVLVNNKSKYDNFYILNVCANGYVYRNNNAGKPGVYDGTTDGGNPPSCGFHLKYGEFDYMSCGDLTSAPQNRVALYFRDFIGEGHLDAFKAHHHLASNSWGSGMVNNNFDPQVVMNQNFYKKQPDIPTLTGKVFLKTKNFFTTNAHPEAVAENPTEYGEMGGYGGHIVLRVAPGGGEFYVYMLDDTDFGYKVKSIHGPYSSK